jgi:XTP/dITP diphosphohydrolase
LRKGGSINIGSANTTKHNEIFFATTNLGKFKEAELMASEHGITLKHLPLKKVEIQSDSLTEIAMHSLYNVMSSHNLAVMVEDAGLFVEILKGFPGPYSSYIYRTIGIEGILKLMKGISDRRAHFISTIAFASPRRKPEIFTGKVNGYIIKESRGTGGFGFDPIFQPQSESRTFADMSSEEKNKFSHRAKAFTKLVNWLTKYG